MPLIKDVWDPSKTLSQNYSEIGLISFLNGRAGGKSDSSLNYSTIKNKLNKVKEEQVEWKMISDVSSIQETKEEEKLIGEPLLEVDDRVLNLGSRVNLKKLRNLLISNQDQKKSEIVDKLKELSCLESSIVRKCSSLEESCLMQLCQKYGDDYEKMSKDLKLNVYQLSPGQLKKKIRKISL